MLFEALAGYPPFAGATVDETWQNLKRWQKVLRKPVYEDPNYFLSRRTWDLITKLVAAKDTRFKNIHEIHAHDYFSEVDFNRLREQRAPFVPELDSETDAGYFDDFSSEADMAKYKEVHDKQRALEEMAEREDKMSKGLFVGFTFRFVSFRVDLVSMLIRLVGTASPLWTVPAATPPANRSQQMVRSGRCSNLRWSLLSSSWRPCYIQAGSWFLSGVQMFVYEFNGALFGLHCLPIIFLRGRA